MVDKIELIGPWAPGRHYYLQLLLYACTVVREDAKKKNETEGTIGFFVTFLLLETFRFEGAGSFGHSYDCKTSMLFVILRFCVLFCLFAFVCMSSDTNGFVLYAHAKYVMLLVKVKIVLNSRCNLKL